MVYRLAFARAGNSHDAQDIMQEVFLSYIRTEKTRKPFENEEHRKAWFIRAAVNAAINLSRSAFKRRSIGELDDGFSNAEYGESREDENISRLETKAVVYPAVMSLPEKYRTIIHLFYYEDMKITEICKITGLGENTVKSRLLRARNILKEKLKEVGFDEFYE